MILSRNCYLKVQREVTQKVSKQELWFLRSARRLMLVNICLKFHENTSVGRVSAPGNGRSRVRSRAATYQSRKKWY